MVDSLLTPFSIFLSVENNETELCIIMEYCGCGDLAQKVERYKRRRQYMDEDVVWRYLIQCLKALEHLHEKNICHRDIKVANCFLAEDGSVKVGDMNVSKRLKRGLLQTQIGTPYYMSPEICRSEPYSYASDVWALGCVLYEMCMLKHAFESDSLVGLVYRIVSDNYDPIPTMYSYDLAKLIRLLLNKEANKNLNEKNDGNP